MRLVVRSNVVTGYVRLGLMDGDMLGAPPSAPL